MKKWSFNFDLLSSLSDVLDKPFTRIAKSLGIEQQVFDRYVQRKYILSVQKLILLCNEWRLPIYYFISEDGVNIIPERCNATRHYEEWSPITWSKVAVESTFGDSEGKIYWKDVALAMDVTERVPHGRFLLKTRFLITDFLDCCTALQISPFKFLIDNNRPGIRKAIVKKKAVRKAAQPDELTALRQEIEELRRRIESLETMYSRQYTICNEPDRSTLLTAADEDTNLIKS